MTGYTCYKLEMFILKVQVEAKTYRIVFIICLSDILEKFF